MVPLKKTLKLNIYKPTKFAVDYDATNMDVAADKI